MATRLDPADLDLLKTMLSDRISDVRRGIALPARPSLDPTRAEFGLSQHSSEAERPFAHPYYWAGFVFSGI